MEKISDYLIFLYGVGEAPRIFARVEKIIAEYRRRIPARKNKLAEHDSILITYGDQVQATNEKPLPTLRSFCEKYLDGVVSGIHILPFFPWSSDDGFSVTDYRKVDSVLGDWNDMSSLQNHFRLMFDGVINHISSQSEWFQGFLRDDAHYRDYFITVEGEPDLSRVVRPRALPLLTGFQTSSGEKRVWTTFSKDQIDLNYKNPEVMLEMLDVLLMYVERGADFIRLDAIAYLWKEIGTSCIHLPQTHRFIRLLRAVLDEVAPYVQLITETNVPHTDNISYFGDGTDEAQLVYNFALPPLTLHTFHTGDARVLSEWAKTLTLPSDKTTFFNFLASHDGIGLNPARGILSDADIDALIQKTLAHGGLISYKQNADGTQSPYEMNINYFDALSSPQLLTSPSSATETAVGAPLGAKHETLDLQVDRFIASQAIMLSLVGVPGIYFHSLFGSHGWPDGVKQTGRNRTINRQKLQLDELQNELEDENSLRAKVFTKYRQLLKARSSSPAFDPHGEQRVVDLKNSIFSVIRVSPDHAQRVLCLQNVSGDPEAVSVNFEDVLGIDPQIGWIADLICGKRFKIRRKSPIRLRPYESLWLTTK